MSNLDFVAKIFIQVQIKMTTLSIKGAYVISKSMGVLAIRSGGKSQDNTSVTKVHSMYRPSDKYRETLWGANK